MNTGSLIAARLNLNPLTVLIIGLIILAALAVTWFINHQLSLFKDSRSYAEKNINRATSKKDINSFISKLNLSKSESLLFSQIFTTHTIPNIHFAMKETDILESYLKEKFSQLHDNNEELKETLFTLRQKVIHSIDSKTIIKNSKILPIQTLFTFTPDRGIHYTFIIVNSNPAEMWLELPENLAENDKPAILSKIKLNFIYGNNCPYELETRVIRYQKDKNNKDLLICTQTDKVNPLQKRNAQRLELNTACEFASVKTEKTPDNKNTTFIPSDKMHDGLLADVSAGGCRIFTSLPIKPEQYILVKGPLDGKNITSSLGLILRTTKNRNNEYILHIRWVKMELSMKNKINAAACGYN